MRFGIIGAGAAGLCAARHALARIAELGTGGSVVVFEQTDTVGGTWHYTDETGVDQYGCPIHSSMYKNMRTNIPKEVMAFPDYPFPTEHASFVSHRSVLRYLQLYAEHFDITPTIRFRESVKTLRRCKEGNVWEITSESVVTRQQTNWVFDVVFVCNGHYAVPDTPNLPQRSKFKGSIMHSHDYRENLPFTGRTVAILGGGPSGVDIAIELAAVCPKVYLCHNKPTIQSWLPPNVTQTGGMVEFTGENSVLLTTGESILVEDVVFCTGYQYWFPFIDHSTIRLSIDDRRMTPLYQHLVHVDHPSSLFFIGVCYTICPFPFFDVQIRFAVALCRQPKLLPTETELKTWEENDFTRRITDLKLKTKQAHYMGAMQWDYIAELSALGGFECPVLPVVRKLYDQVHHIRAVSFVDYKNERFSLLDNSSFFTEERTDRNVEKVDQSEKSDTDYDSVAI